MATARIAVIGGDGIGPEVIEQAIRVVEAALRHDRATLEWNRLPWNTTYYKQHGRMLPAVSRLQAAAKVHTVRVSDPGRFNQLYPGEVAQFVGGAISRGRPFQATKGSSIWSPSVGYRARQLVKTRGPGHLERRSPTPSTGRRRSASSWRTPRWPWTTTFRSAP